MIELKIFKNICYFYYIKFLYFIGFINNNTYYDNIIEIIKKNGVVFVKLAQIISSRKDLGNVNLDPLFKSKLTNLQDKCFYDLEPIIFDDFNYINNTPISAGSICNIHLINYNNKKSILKTKQKNINNKIHLGIKIISKINSLYNFFSRKNINIINYDDFYKNLLKQTDLNQESNNQNKFADIFKDYDSIRVPEIQYDYDFIIMEYIEGIKMDDFIKKYPELKNEVYSIVYCALCKMISNGIIHSDFHNGNFLFNLEEGKVKMTILDYGIVCQLNKEQNYHLNEFLNLRNIRKWKKKSHHLRRFFIALNPICENIIIEKNLENAESVNFIDIMLNSGSINIPSEFISFFSTFQVLNETVLDIEEKNYDYKY